MKKIFYLASIAALAFSSCAKDETTEAALGTVGGSKIVAAMEADDTRTQLDANGTYKWSAGDQLGVYGIGAHTLNNAAFVLDNSAANSAVGVFASQSTALEAGKPYLAVYPRLQKSIISQVNMLEDQDIPSTAATEKIDVINPAGLVVEILDEQKYQNGSFYTNTAPAVSSSFVVDANGASVEMQPVVDYLFVNIKSTEPIETLTLQLRKNGSYLDIAGKSALTGYWYGSEYRYYAGIPTTDAKPSIVLETDETYKSVVCHEPNTYVFVVPAGILGMGNDVEALINVNGKSGDKHYLAAVKTSDPALENAALADYRVANTGLNLRYIDQNGDGVAETPTHRNMTYTNGALIYKQENTVFWMNPVDPYTGERTSFMYNPNGDVIIEHEGDLLRYLVEYEKNNPAYKNDAIICDNHDFDFSYDHMKELSSELEYLGVWTEYQDYIEDYIMGNFPTISTYNHNFEGSDAEIVGIVYELASKNGIFGTINGSVNNVEFSNIETATWEYKASPKVEMKGLVLGTLGTTGKIDNVTVNNANAMAILGTANSAALAELTVTGVQNLNYVVADMNLTAGLDLTEDWATVSGVKTAVFGSLNASANTDGDYHHVVKLPATADYAKLAKYIGTDVAAFTVANTDEIVKSINNEGAAKKAVTTDNDVVSVLVGDTSYWTGDKFSTTSYATTDGVKLSKYSKSTDVVNGWPVNGYYKIEYAEQLATGLTANDNAVVMRPMNLTKATNLWETVNFKHLEGNNQLISGIKMNIEGVATATDVVVAPMDVATLTNVKAENVAINIATTSTTFVPQFIGGLVKDAAYIEGVEVNGLTITGSGYGPNNEQYMDSYPVFLGWLVADVTDAAINTSKVLNVKNEIIGIAGLVGRLSINETAHIKNSSAAVTSMVQTSLDTFKNFAKAEMGADKSYSKSNFAGTAVGHVKNNATSAKVVKFEGVGQPVFGYNANSGDIKVIYDAGAEADVVLKSTGNYAW